MEEPKGLLQKATELMKMNSLTNTVTAQLLLGTIAWHKKTNRLYYVTGLSLDSTNSTDGRVLIRYKPLEPKEGEEGVEYAREVGEFVQKFLGVNKSFDPKNFDSEVLSEQLQDPTSVLSQWLEEESVATTLLERWNSANNSALEDYRTQEIEDYVQTTDLSVLAEVKSMNEISEFIEEEAPGYLSMEQFAELKDSSDVKDFALAYLQDDDISISDLLDNKTSSEIKDYILDYLASNLD